jgi:hypothetical protein
MPYRSKGRNSLGVAETAGAHVTSEGNNGKTPQCNLECGGLTRFLFGEVAGISGTNASSMEGVSVLKPSTTRGTKRRQAAALQIH